MSEETFGREHRNYYEFFPYELFPVMGYENVSLYQ